MQIDKFIKARESDWKRLETLAGEQHKLRLTEIYELSHLYRTVMSDLAVAQRDYPNHQVTIFLNQLLIRTHSFIYQSDVTRVSALSDLITRTIPHSFRQIARFVLAAALLFVIPALIGFWLTSANPSIAVPLGLEAQRRILAQHDTWTDIPQNERPTASTFIITNNIRVALLAFAGGVVFGLFSVYVLINNGLMIGAVLGLASHYGMAGSLLDFIVAHGILELSIIVIAGGAGLSMGGALLNPGRFTRLNALKVAAGRSVYLAILAVPVLITAGLLEGFVSPSSLSSLLKLLIGFLSGIALYAYLALSRGDGKGSAAKRTI